MTVNYVDSHAHLTADSVYPHVDEFLKRAFSQGISSIVNICTDEKSLERGLELVKRYPSIYNAAATTPHDVRAEGEPLFPLMAKTARSGRLVAVGETGLDYFHNHSPKDLQQQFLRRYLHLALECHLPVIIHCRDAFTDLFTILDAEYTVGGKHASGVLHCFTGNISEAENVLKRGWYLSLSGIVTFKKSGLLRDVAKMVPLDRLLIETDTPYLAPESKRGRMNEPAYLLETASFIADCKNLKVDEIAEATSKNARELFNLTLYEDRK